MTPATNLLDHILNCVDFNVLKREKFKKHVCAEECILVAHIHILTSSVPFFRRLIALGFRPSAIYIIPKAYSAIPASMEEVARLGCHVMTDAEAENFRPGHYDAEAERLLRQACLRIREVSTTPMKRCILVDDGGALTECWWNIYKQAVDTVSVQQTASWQFEERFRQPEIRKVNVAKSAAKRYFESSIIATGVLRKVATLDLQGRNLKNVAVIGLGNVGSRLARELAAGGNDVDVFDLNEAIDVRGTHRARSIQTCIKDAGVVFGCTGKDIFKSKIDMLSGMGRKYFISLSSRDTEFRELLRTPGARRRGTFGPTGVRLKGSGPFIVMNGGFPINFDREREWETDDEISLTRALVLLGILQALYLPVYKPTKAIEKLSLLGQQTLVSEWLKRRGKRPDQYDVTVKQFKDLWWWYQESWGAEYKGGAVNPEEAHLHLE